MLYKSSGNSPSVQVLHQQIRGLGVKICADFADKGVQDLGKPTDVILSSAPACSSLLSRSTNDLRFTLVAPCIIRVHLFDK